MCCEIGTECYENGLYEDALRTARRKAAEAEVEARVAERVRREMGGA